VPSDIATSPLGVEAVVGRGKRLAVDRDQAFAGVGLGIDQTDQLFAVGPLEDDGLAGRRCAVGQLEHGDLRVKVRNWQYLFVVGAAVDIGAAIGHPVDLVRLSRHRRDGRTVGTALDVHSTDGRERRGVDGVQLDRVGSRQLKPVCAGEPLVRGVHHGSGWTVRQLAVRRGAERHRRRPTGGSQHLRRCECQWVIDLRRKRRRRRRT
jgi:hypothetical protein